MTKVFPREDAHHRACVRYIWLLSPDVTPFRHLDYLDAGWKARRGVRADPHNPGLARGARLSTSRSSLFSVGGWSLLFIVMGGEEKNGAESR